jgi:hypothetical protein
MPMLEQLLAHTVAMAAAGAVAGGGPEPSVEPD